MKRRDFCKGLAVTLAAGALAPGAALPQAGAATALVGRAVPDDYYTLWYRSDRCSADLRHDTITATACSTTPPQSTMISWHWPPWAWLRLRTARGRATGTIG